MGRAKVGKMDAHAFAMRLKGFAERRYGSWEKFWKEVGFSRTTADAWRGLSPSVPDPPSLLILARKANINLNWLLLGRGHELFEYPDTSPAERVENAIEAELRHSEKDVTFEEFNAAWERLHYRGDFSQREDMVLPLAVEGVRPRFQENLRLVRHYAGVVQVINSIPDALAESGPDGEEKAERVKQLLREALFAGSAPSSDTPSADN